MPDDYEKEYQRFLNEKCMLEEAESEHKRYEQSLSSYRKQKAEINKYLVDFRCINVFIFIEQMKYNKTLLDFYKQIGNWNKIVH
jgi:hypothetical protein